MSVNAEQVRGVVDTVYGGNVNAAAKAWDIPQPTLRRFVLGISSDIAHSTFERIEAGLHSERYKLWAAFSMVDA